MSSWNLRHGIVKSVVDYIIRKFDIRIYNPFRDIARVNTEGKTDSITEHEFYAVLKEVKTGAKTEFIGGKEKIKHRYRDYLEDAFKMALYTGLRREEYLALSWSNIVPSKNEGEYMIVTKNLKVERITNKTYKPKVVPIHSKLEELLIKLGWEKNSSSDEYIIKPKRTAKIETMMKCCTHAFKHYYLQAFPDEEHKPLGCLRNTYLSMQNLEVGDDMIELSSYGSMKTPIKHHIDNKLVVKGAGMEMF
jgi:integrase